MTALREIAAKFGITFDKTPLEEGAKRIDSAKDKLVNLSFEINQVSQAFGVVFGGAIGRALGFVRDFEEDAGRLEDTAHSLNLTTDQLQELDVAATRAGLRTQQMTAAMLRFSGSVEAAAAGGGAQAEVFNQLGVKVKDASGQVRNSSDVMNDLATAFSRVQDPAKRSHMAVELFGRQGARLATILHDGAGGLQELRGELAELGGGLTADAVATAGEFGDELDRLKVASDSLRSSIVVVLLPAVTWITDKIKDATVFFSRLARGTSLVQAAILMLAAIVLPPLLTVVSVVGGMIAPWIALGLVIDDVITFFRGGKSVLGEFLDKLFGVGTANTVLRGARELWDSLTFAMGKAWDILKEFWNGLKEVLPELGSGLMEVFRQVGDFFARMWTNLTNMYGRFISFLERIPGLGGIMSRYRAALQSPEVRDLLSAGAGAVGGAARGIARAAGETIGDYASNGNSLFLGSAATVPRAMERGVQQNNAISIHVNGANASPQEIARHVQREIRRTQATQLEQAHAARRDVAEPG